MHGPSIPTALLKTTKGTIEVHPAAEDWYQQVDRLRKASQTGLLFCPDCNKRLTYYSEVRTPHFRHKRGERGCTIDLRYPELLKRRQEKSFRNLFVHALRQVLPEGTRMEATEYLNQRTSHLIARLPTEKSVILNVVTEKPQMALWNKQKEEFQALRMPVVHIFARTRIKAALRKAVSGRTVVRIDDGLNADHLDARQTRLVDFAHMMREQSYQLPHFSTEPGSIFFFQEGASLDDPSYLILLRGFVPNPKDTFYHGVALKFEATGHGKGALRFHPRYGFYTKEDLDVLVHFRDQFRQQRREQIERTPRSALTPKHPIRRLWESVQAQLIAKRDQAKASLASAGPPSYQVPNPLTFTVQNAALQPAPNAPVMQPTLAAAAAQSSAVTPRKPLPKKPESDRLRCRQCGDMTHDWATKKGDTCLCKACSFRNSGLEPKFCPGCGNAFPPQAPFRGELCMECHYEKRTPST